MTDALKQAAQQALEALENDCDWNVRRSTAESLRAALAAPQAGRLKGQTMAENKSLADRITIKTRPIGMHTEVQGYVGTHEVMSMSSRPGGAWMVGSSSCLPADVERAALYVECMRRVFERAREHGAP